MTRYAYWCPASGQYECAFCSGFDVCCDHPERHEKAVDEVLHDPDCETHEETEDWWGRMILLMWKIDTVGWGLLGFWIPSRGRHKGEPRT